MLEQFKSYLKNKLFLSKNDKVLLAVSGGKDSVVMLDLFARCAYKIAVAHCNFHLRGTESMLDEQLTEKLTQKYKVPYYKIDFDTYAYAEKKRISIEMAARELRYNWFEKIRQENAYDYIATAHHSDDVVESFFLNLARGTGIRGLSGIKAKSNRIIRSLLFTNRNQIEEYIQKNELKYREDSSNKDIRFKRNKLRHDIIPQFAEINSAYKENILKSIDLLNITNDILQEKITEIRTEICSEKDIHVFFDIKKISTLKHRAFYLFELLAPYGFNATQVEDIINSLNGISGKTFFSDKYQIVKDRAYLILSPIDDKNKYDIIHFSENELMLMINPSTALNIEYKQISKDFRIPTSNKIAALDKDKLKFPLTIRPWKNGDYFYPLGMNQKKKLSDFFIDKKIPTIKKRNILVLISGNDIVWVIGYRIDNRYKIHPDTKNIMQISLNFI